MKNLNRREFLEMMSASAAGLLLSSSPAAAWVGTRTRKPISTSSKEVVAQLGLTTNWKLCLDAGDATSYTSGQTWSDISGGGNHFYRGGGSGTESSDPPFNGLVGTQAPSPYWSFNDNQWFTLVAASNPTWLINLHKNNAIYSGFAWLYMASAARHGILSTAGSQVANTGFSFLVDENQKNHIFATNGSGSYTSIAGAITVPLNQWVYCGVSVNEGTGSGIFQMNDQQETFNSTYTSPSTGNPSFKAQVAASGANDYTFNSGSRLAMVNFWEGTALTASNLDSLYQATRRRFSR